MAIRLPRDIQDFAARFSEEGHQIFLVGGALRDIYLGLKPEDFDFATDALPETVLNLFPRVLPTGIKHGTVTVLFRGKQIEVTTFRSESDYSDGRHPDHIEFGSEIEADLSRRDFTMNSIAYDMADKKIFDPFSGRKDIRHRIIRAIGNPVDRFREDGLRSIRACRFASQLNFRIEGETQHAAAETVDRSKLVARERIRMELEKLFCSEKPSIGLLLMEQFGLLADIIPELSACKGVEQKGFHRFDVFEHSLLACDAAPRDDLIIRLAALLHDIGKPLTMEILPDGRRTFYNHEKVSAELAEKRLTALTFSNKIIRRVRRLIEQHMFNFQDEWSDAAVRRFVSRAGSDILEELFQLREADRYAITGRSSRNTNLEELRSRIGKIKEEGSAVTIRDLAVDGNLLAEKAGIPKSKKMGQVLDFLLESVIEDPALNTKEKLIEIGSQYYRKYLA
ncbi:MAG: CCA tRNA nucleotidyltransferase [Spirochaetales bacterium]|nr:CCA tRNA nucleotidyltransferase [Spirochaetales bacterium]